MATETAVAAPENLDTRSWIRKQIEDLPQWAHTIVVLAVIGFVLYLVYTKKAEVPVININPVPLVSQTEKPVNVLDATRPFHPAKNLFLSVVKHKVKKCLTQDGFNLIGGNPTKLTSEEADRLLSNLDDESILEGAKTTGVLSDGTLLDKLSALVDWLLSHQDQIINLVKWIMQILMMFA